MEYTSGCHELREIPRSNNEFAETRQMQQLYVARGRALLEGLGGSNRVKAHMPEGGMFVMVDVRKTRLSGEEFAWKLLREKKVVTMPGTMFMRVRNGGT